MITSGQIDVGYLLTKTPEASDQAAAIIQACISGWDNQVEIYSMVHAVVGVYNGDTPEQQRKKMPAKIRRLCDLETLGIMQGMARQMLSTLDDVLPGPIELDEVVIGIKHGETRIGMKISGNTYSLVGSAPVNSIGSYLNCASELLRWHPGVTSSVEMSLRLGLVQLWLVGVRFKLDGWRDNAIGDLRIQFTVCQNLCDHLHKVISNGADLIPSMHASRPPCWLH